MNIYTAARQFINSRPGLCGANYSTRAQYQADYRRATKYKEPALALLDECARLDLDITGRTGRITLNKDGSIDYLTGQYRPTEYRAAMLNHLARVLADAGAQDREIVRKYTRG